METKPEKKGGKDLIIVALFEILGNAVLVSAISAVSQTGGMMIGISYSLYLAIQFTGDITGGHINPAVTLAVLIAGSHYKKIGIAIILFISQAIGACLGVIIAHAAIGKYASLAPSGSSTET